MKKFAFFSTLVLTAIFASATPPNTPVLDGRPIEYDATDLRAVFGAEPAWTTVTVSNLFVTWDATNLYIGYQAWLQSDKLVVIIDADPDAAPPTGATTTTNWIGNDDDFPGYIKFNEFGWTDTQGHFGLDYMLASEGTYNNILRVLYDGTSFVNTNDIVALFDAPNGNTRTGGTLDMACERNSSPCPPTRASKPKSPGPSSMARKAASAPLSPAKSFPAARPSDFWPASITTSRTTSTVAPTPCPAKPATSGPTAI